ncbi:MAG: hypothetical protein GXO66_03580 [Euryarchaeota archaeon]|nr:hypothetical protein [Euryarchaeota archaeon]
MSTSAEVDPGSCGFVTRIRVERLGREVRVRVNSECERVKKFAGALERLEVAEALAPMCASPVYRAATRARLHPGCAVPAALLRAVEVESGAATPAEVRITFRREEE